MKLTDNMTAALLKAEFRAYDATQEGHTGWSIITMDGRTRSAMHRRGLMHGHYYLTAEGVKAREEIMGIEPVEEPMNAPVVEHETYAQSVECTCSKGAPSPGCKPCLHCGGDNSWCARHYPAPQPFVEDLPDEIPATPQDTEIQFMGSGALQWSWWNDMEPTYNPAVTDAPDDWSYVGIPGYAEDMDHTSSPSILNHESLSRAIREIAKLDKFAESPFRKYVNGWTISECNVWLYQGPDHCNFDAPMADEVMQYAVFGEVVYG